MKQNPLDIKGRHMPRRPRIVLGGYLILPVVDENWKPVKDQWVIPGWTVPMTTDEVRALAKANDLMFFHTGEIQ